MTLAYIKAIAASDWSAACETRIPSERKELARMGGSCERAFEVMMAGKPLQLLATLEVRDVRVRDDLASVDLAQPGQTDIAMTMVARKMGNRWFLEDLPDGAGP